MFHVKHWFNDELERAIAAAVNPLKDDIRALKQLPVNTKANRTRNERIEQSINRMEGILRHVVVLSVVSTYVLSKGDKETIANIFDTFEDSDKPGADLFRQFRKILLRDRQS